MKNATTMFATALVLIMLAGLSFSQVLERRAVHEAFSPRITDSVCPPDYRTTREVIDRHFEGNVTVSGPNLNHLAEDFGTRSITADDFKVLNDEEDAEACVLMNERYSADIDRQIRIYDGADPEYLHDIAYYSTADFNFVVFAGGILIQENPMEPGRKGLHISHSVVNKVVAFDKNWQIIYDRETREALAQQHRKSTDNLTRD